MVVLRIGEREDEADLHELAQEPVAGAAVVCLLADDVRLAEQAHEDCRRLARHRPVVLVRHPSIDPCVVSRSDPTVATVVAALRGAVGGAADTCAPGLREVVVSLPD